MTMISYGNPGAVLQFGLIKTGEWRREPVYDGPNYVHTKHVYPFRLLYNPSGQANSGRWGVSARFAGGGPGAVPGALPAVTDAAIRQTLSTPRLQLTISDADPAAPPIGNVILQSPRNDPNNGGAPFPCDAGNGPFPSLSAITAIEGGKTWVVDCTFTTFVDESYLYRGTGDPERTLLSHQFRMTEQIDRTCLSTRIIEGHAVFNPARLYNGQAPGTPPVAFPDDFRSYLFAPVPWGFIRDNVSVTAQANGTELDYVLIDKMLPAYYGDQGVRRIEATQRVEGNRIGTESVSIGLARIAIRRFIPSLSADLGGTETEFGLASKLAGEGFGLLTSLLPLRQLVVEARVWGTGRTPRLTLQNVAVNICSRRAFDALHQAAIRQPNAKARSLFLGDSEAVLEHDLAGSYVSCRMAFLSSLSNLGGSSLDIGPADPVVGPIARVPWVLDMYPDAASYADGSYTDDVPANTAGQPPGLTRKSWDFAVHSLPSADTAHGDYLGHLAAQVLLDSRTQFPPEALDPGPAQFLTPD